MRRAFGLLNGKSVQFDADRDRAARPAGVPGGKKPRIVADAADFLGRHAHLEREAPSLFNLIRVAAADKLRRDELRTIGHREARAAEGLCKPCRRDEFAPAGLGRSVDVAPGGDEILKRYRIDPAGKEVRTIHQIGNGRSRLFLCCLRFSRRRRRLCFLNAPGPRAHRSGRRIRGGFCCLNSGWGHWGKLQIIRAQRYRVDALRGFAYFYTLHSNIAQNSLNTRQTRVFQYPFDFSMLFQVTPD